MDTTIARDELVDSVRLLVDEERRLLAGLVGGGAGFLVWVAGTGVTVGRLVEMVRGPVSVDPWSGEASLLVAVFFCLWVVVPSVLAVRFVLGEVLNLRGNVEQRYRFDQPLVLLVAPLAGLVAVVGVALVLGVGVGVLLALWVASAVLLARTVAYGYRVYSLSVPRLLQAALFVAAALVGLSVAVQTAGLADQQRLVAAAIGRAGLSGVASGTVRIGAVSAPLVALTGAAAPAAVALAYVGLQLLASLVVRARKPEVPRSAIRAGQRHPGVVQPGASERLAVGAGPAEGATDDGGSATNGNGTPEGATEKRGDADEAGDGSGDDEDDAVGPDRFGETRVYTPSSDAQATDPELGKTSVKNELCPICGVTYEAEPDRTNCPNCNAILDED